MRISIAYVDYSDIFAGAERMLETIIIHSNYKLFDLHVVWPFPMPHHARYQFSNAHCHYISSGISWWMGSKRWNKPIRGADLLSRIIFGVKLCSILKRHSISILHVNLLRADCFFWLLPSFLAGIKIIGHFRSISDEWIPPARVVRLCSKIICVSDYNMNVLLKHHPDAPVVRLYDSLGYLDCIDVFEDKGIETMKNMLGIPLSSILISSVGQLSKHKGHDTAIKAFALIASKYSDCHLAIIGGGSDEELRRLKQLSDIYPQFRDRIHFSEIQITEMENVYRASDIILSLTKCGEAFGLVPFEAASFNIPFIAVDRGAIKEFVKNRETGYLAQPDSPIEVSEYIMEILDNRELANDYNKRLKRHIVESLNPDVMMSKLETLYKDVLV